MKKTIVIACSVVFGMTKTQVQDFFRLGITVFDYGYGNHNNVVFSLGATYAFNIK